MARDFRPSNEAVDDESFPLKSFLTKHGFEDVTVRDNIMDELEKVRDVPVRTEDVTTSSGDDSEDEEERRGREQAKVLSQYYNSLWTMNFGRSRYIHIEKQSVYNSTIVMTNIARSSGWTLTFTAMTCKLVFLACSCIVLQLFFCDALWCGVFKMQGLDGVPHLCTYGFDYGDKDNPPRGPLGVAYEPNRGNIEPNFGMVLVRNTLAQVLNALSNTSTPVSNPDVGPVEYGMESASCRFAAVSLFLIAVTSHVASILEVVRYLWWAPTQVFGKKDQPEISLQWIVFKDYSMASAKVKTRLELWRCMDKTDLDHVEFRMMGMPRCFKLLAFMLVVVRGYIVFSVTQPGVYFLMETGGIVDLILESLVLVFILELDGLFFRTFAHPMTVDIIKRLQPFEIESRKLDEDIKKMNLGQTHYGVCAFIWDYLMLCRHSLITVVLIVLVFFIYLFRRCDPVQWPLAGSFEIFKTNFFEGDFMTFGGFDFWFGRWVSKNVTAMVYEDGVTPQEATTCAVFLEATGRAAEGCALPEPWSWTYSGS